MKITKEQLKEIIKEELSTLEEGAHQFTVDQLRDLLNDTTGDKIIINNGDLVVYEHFVDADGNLQLSVEPRR
tara:strand:+ start:1330 stop:1545 length:216 start_codon:yes stop_codon:yes gene_type:complete